MSTVLQNINEPIITQTGGDGLWSNVKKTVKLLRVDVHGCNEEYGGMMDVYFDRATWDTSVDGLIYTDKTWIKSFHEAINQRFGITMELLEGIDYTECGMQGDDFVSLEFGTKFLAHITGENHGSTFAIEE